ncbi:plasmid transfer protein TraF [Nitrospirillum viridazoti Y2]|nr:plasmid transfer protein TraF [Nitrospirillum amazonense Y2]
MPSIQQPAPRLVWNASASAPIGLYLVQPGRVAVRGDLVLARTPDAVVELAAARGYLPAGVPLVKRVAALSGDVVCGDRAAVSINGVPVAVRLDKDSHGRPLSAWEGCRVLLPGDLFLLMADVPGSFDSRYFGPVQAGTIIGRLVPLWTD